MTRETDYETEILRTRNLRLRHIGYSFLLEAFQYEHWVLLAEFHSKEEAVRAFNETALYMS